ncbi:MAG TPA: hypothetical protein VGX23_33510 [Actinocrinis sp.]|nr:hypothetical protein [Actinocrinis sp.]
MSFAIVFLVLPFTAYLLYVHLHLNSAGVLFPPDSGYYTVMTLRDIGYSVPHAVSRTNTYTNFPVNSPMFADSNPTWLLVRSRVLYPLISAPFVAALGLRYGMLIVPAVSVLVFLFFTGRTLQRLHGPFVALIVIFFVSLCYVLTNELFFATTDLLALAFLSIFFDNLPLYRRNSLRNNVMLCVALLLIAATRQDGVYPLALLCGGWLWSAVSARSWRTDWTLPTLMIAPITLVVDIVSQVISPVHVQALVSSHAGTSGVGGTIASVPRMAWSLTIADFHFMQAQDKVLFTLFCVAVIFMVFRLRAVETGLMVAGAAAVYLIIVPIGVPVGMRYEIVLLPVTAVIAGRVVQGFCQRMTVPQQARRSSTSMR